MIHKSRTGIANITPSGSSFCAMALDQGVLDSWAPFWNTWIVFQALYFGANLALFYQRRHMQPIKFLQPMQLLTVNVFGALYGITLSTMYVEPRGSIFIKIVVPQMFLSAMCDMYALIAGGIMIAFSRTTEQLHLSNNRSPLESKQIARFIRISKIVLSQRFSAVFLISSAIIQLSLQTAYAMAHPNLIFATVADGFDEQTYVPEFISIGVKKIALDCAIFVFVAVKLRIVTDVHGIKANLKRAAICSIIGLTGFTISMVFTDKHETNRGFTVSSQLSNLLYTLVNFVAFTLTLTIPIVQTMQHRRTSRIQIEVHGDLEEFLRTPGGLAAFKLVLQIPPKKPPSETTGKRVLIFLVLLVCSGRSWRGSSRLRTCCSGKRAIGI
uniref:THH1/TOM1/TOM3 domain-containing protein n=1 Tax=Spongospora subterranea TaxID=70186 RepID=A0A0H5R3Z6_9EUKA|eukprot:CRZ02744.1 hypothetical protein [Spongospora subterranea]